MAADWSAPEREASGAGGCIGSGAGVESAAADTLLAPLDSQQQAILGYDADVLAVPIGDDNGVLGGDGEIHQSVEIGVLGGPQCLTQILAGFRPKLGEPAP